MEETRIRRNLIILGVVTFIALVGIIAAWSFVLVRPNDAIEEGLKEEYAKLQETASGLEKAQEDERKALDKLEYLEGQLAFFRGSEVDEKTQGLYRRLYFGPIDGTSELNTAARQVAWRQWMNEYHYAYGPALGFELDRIAKLAGVEVPIPTIKVDDPPQRPEDVKVPDNGLLKPLSATDGGQVNLTVTGTFDEILRFLEYINHSRILMVVGNIKLEAYSAAAGTLPLKEPTLKATFPITPYLIAAGPGIKLSASYAAAAAESTPGAAGGLPGGAAGGAPGGPPGGAPSGAAGAAPGAPAQSEGSTVKIKNPRLGA